MGLVLTGGCTREENSPEKEYRSAVFCAASWQVENSDSHPDTQLKKNDLILFDEVLDHWTFWTETWAKSVGKNKRAIVSDVDAERKRLLSMNSSEWKSSWDIRHTCREEYASQFRM